MGLLDMFSKRRASPDVTVLSKDNNSSVIVNPNNLEKALAERVQAIRLEDCTRIPLGTVGVLGASFAQIIPALRTVAQTVTVDGMGFIPINNLSGETLKMYSKATPEVFAGAFNRGGKSVMAQLVKVGPQTITSSAVMPINPAMIIMAAMLVSIDKKLDKIQETQQHILSFLEQDKQAEMQANLNILGDILEGYKHNWDNDQYKTNHHIKVLDIKQSSEKNAIFYQSQIAEAIQHLPTIHLEQAVNDAVKKLTGLFHHYRMALYLYAYSSFLEVMLLENFREEYLSQVSDKVKENSTHYQNQFEKCRDMIKSYSSASVEKQVIGSLGTASKALGKLIAVSPLLSKGPVDEWLQSSGNKLLKDNEKSAEKTAARFDIEAEIGTEMFVESIKCVNIICNQTTGVLFDNDAIYIATA